MFPPPSAINNTDFICRFGDSYSDVRTPTGDNGTAWPVYAAGYAKVQLHPFARAGAVWYAFHSASLALLNLNSKFDYAALTISPIDLSHLFLKANFRRCSPCKRTIPWSCLRMRRYILCSSERTMWETMPCSLVRVTYLMGQQLSILRRVP